MNVDKMNEHGRKWKKVNESGMNENSRWKWMKVNESGRKWIKQMKVDENKGLSCNVTLLRGFKSGASKSKEVLTGKLG